MSEGEAFLAALCEQPLGELMMHPIERLEPGQRLAFGKLHFEEWLAEHPSDGDPELLFHRFRLQVVSMRSNPPAALRADVAALHRASGTRRRVSWFARRSVERLAGWEATAALDTMGRRIRVLSHPTPVGWAIHALRPMRRSAQEQLAGELKRRRQRAWNVMRACKAPPEWTGDVARADEFLARLAEAGGEFEGHVNHRIVRTMQVETAQNVLPFRPGRERP